MSDQEQTVLLDEIEKRLRERKTTVRNKAAVGALLKLIPQVGESLHHALTAGDAAEEAERTRIKLDLMADLLVRIDGAISEVATRAAERGIEWTEVGGTIRLSATAVDSATGVHIKPDSGPVRFEPGTEINVEANNVREVTGLMIGGHAK